MKIIDEITGSEILDPDLSIGELIPSKWASIDAYDSIDNITKFAIDDDEWENVLLYRIPSEDEINQNIIRDESNTALEERDDSFDNALCELYETTLSQSAIMDEQDAAICALYEMMED